MQMSDIQSLFLQSPRLNQLNILREVAANAHVTQAELASRCSLSVAMVNNYMKDLCASGLLEYHRKTTKSVSYHITESGKQHLNTLQGKLIDEMVEMFVAAKEQIRSRIAGRTQSTPQRIILYGSGNLAQLTFHALELAGSSVVGVCDDDPEKIGRDFCGREITSPSQIRFLAPNAVVVADSVRTEQICQNLEFLVDRGIDIIRLDVPAEQKSQPCDTGTDVPMANEIDGVSVPLAFSQNRD